MADVVLQQAWFHRDHDESPRLLACSPGMSDAWITSLTEWIVRFGVRPPGVLCSGGIFARPLDRDTVAVVLVLDAEPGPSGWAGLRFRVLVLRRQDYETLGGDPFALMNRFWAEVPASDLPWLSCPAESLSPPSLEKVRAVLRRVKAHALPEGTDPANPPPLDVENAESPTLLGGVQILVDGGRLVFERSRPDTGVVQALWTLLPLSLRSRLWPASFTFSNELGFDVLVVPDVRKISLEGFTTEDQAGDYPAGSYELALQTAAETGDEHELQAVLRRRTSSETMRLGVRLLVLLAALVLVFRWLPPQGPRTDTPARAATAAGIIAVGDPWTAAAMLEAGNRIFLKR